MMPQLVRKAFYPAVPPLPLLHVDTTWKFREMYSFRDGIVEQMRMDLIVHQNADAIARDVNPFTHGSAMHTDVWMTEVLKQALDKYRFDVAFGGARRDEEVAGQGRVFSLRSAQQRLGPQAAAARTVADESPGTELTSTPIET